MSPRRVTVALWGSLAGGVLLGARLLAWPLVRVSLPVRPEARGGPTQRVEPVPTDSLAALLVTRDPFRLSRQPAAVAYDPLRLAQQAASPPKPPLVLVGLVVGNSPAAIIDGLPGVDGARVVRAGEIVGPLRVRRIERDRVVVTGMDTVWTLMLRRPWP
jgi:hypothetical protein